MLFTYFKLYDSLRLLFFEPNHSRHGPVKDVQTWPGSVEKKNIRWDVKARIGRFVLVREKVDITFIAGVRFKYSVRNEDMLLCKFDTSRP